MGGVAFAADLLSASWGSWSTSTFFLGLGTLQQALHNCPSLRVGYFSLMFEGQIGLQE